MHKPKRVRIVFDADRDYRVELKILSAHLGIPISHLIFHALEKVYGLEPPQSARKSPAGHE